MLLQVSLRKELNDQVEALKVISVDDFLKDVMIVG
jgi:hypothetical protein